MTTTQKRTGPGRPKVPKKEKRIPLRFRLKTYLVKKAARLGRDRVEDMLEREKE